MKSSRLTIKDERVLGIPGLLGYIFLEFPRLFLGCAVQLFTESMLE